MSDVSLETLVSLCKRRGFIYQGSEVYGGLAGTWDYGPLGVTLKRNIMALWWKTFVEDRDDMYGVDAAILMNQKVWQASGHVDTFTDPLIECQHCKTRYRVDNIIDKDKYEQESKKYFETSIAAVSAMPNDYEAFSEEQKQQLVSIFGEARIPAAYPDKQSDNRVEYLKSNQELAKSYLGIFPRIYLMSTQQKCGKCGSVQWGDARTFNMMFKTHAGPIDDTITVQYVESDHIDPESIKAKLDEDPTSVVYLRPETAQGIFTNYKNILDSFYPDLPFGIAQQGKAFRNEISPRDFIFRDRELEQMEIEYFIHPEKWEETFNMWLDLMHKWCESLGLAEENIHDLEVPENDRAHYSKRTVDIEFDFPIGKEELYGLAYRTDFDLQNIQKHSAKNMEYRPKDGGEPFVPHVIEPTFGVERTIMAVLSAAYTEDEINGEKRAYLKLPAHLAPVRVAVSPLLKNKPGLAAKAREVYKLLKAEFGAVMYDDNGNIGKRYRRQDEIGTPYCVTIDFDTLTDDTVTVRSRDTTKQERTPLSDLSAKLTG